MNNINEISKYDDSLSEDDKLIESLELEIEEEDKSNNPYYVSSEMKKKGFRYDSKGLYVYYDYRNEGTEDDLNGYYLKIYREKFRKNQPKYCFVWVMFEDGTYKHLSKIYSNGKSPVEEDGDRNKKLGQYAQTIDLPREKEAIKDFLESTYLSIIQYEGLEIFKDKTFEVDDLSESDEETSEENEEEKNPSCYEDYPKPIQDKALEILKDENLIKRIIDTVRYTVESNETEITELVLNIGGIFVKIAIHSNIEGNSGVGKTQMILETLKNYPIRLVKILRNISPKNMYYDKDNYNDDYNIIFIDDAQLTESSIEVIKELSDNKKEVKEIKTVNKENGTNKAQTYTLPGKYSVIYSYAKNQPDEELSNRFFNMSIRNSEEEKKQIKEKIKENTLVDSEQNLSYSTINTIIQCAIDYLLQSDKKFYNPFLNFIDVSNIANRDIGSIIGCVLSVSFYNQYNRKSIKLLDDEIIVGTSEDYSIVSQLYELDKVEHRYKLDDTQKRILEVLPRLSEKEIDDIIEKVKDDILPMDSIGFRERELKKLDLSTIKNLVVKVDKSESTIRKALSSSNNNKRTLTDLGLVEYFEIDHGRTYPLKVYYIPTIEGEETKSKISVGSLVGNLFTVVNNSPINKILIITRLLYRFNILINTTTLIYIYNYCENYPSINSDEDMFNFINGFCTEHNDVLKYLNIDEITLEELDYHNGINKDIYRRVKEISKGNEPTSKTSNNTSIKKPKKKSSFNQDSHEMNQHEILNERLSEVIENLDDEIVTVFKESDEKVLTSKDIVNTILGKFRNIIDKFDNEQIGNMSDIANDLKMKVDDHLQKDKKFELSESSEGYEILD